MSKLIVVLGATGGQGGSVVNTFLSTPGWRVRGLTRNASSAQASALRDKGVEVVEANTDNQTSLEHAFAGAHAIFAFTDYYDYFFEIGPDKSIARETTQGTNIARAAAKIDSLERFVWSTLPNTELFTQGAAVVPHFQGKANVDAYIKSDLPELYKKTAFVIFTIFGANVVLYEIFRPVYLVSCMHCPSILTNVSNNMGSGNCQQMDPVLPCSARDPLPLDGRPPDQHRRLRACGGHQPAPSRNLRALQCGGPHAGQIPRSMGPCQQSQPGAGVDHGRPGVYGAVLRAVATDG